MGLPCFDRTNTYGTFWNRKESISLQSVHRFWTVTKTGQINKSAELYWAQLLPVQYILKTDYYHTLTKKKKLTKFKISKTKSPDIFFHSVISLLFSVSLQFDMKYVSIQSLESINLFQFSIMDPTDLLSQWLAAENQDNATSQGSSLEKLTQATTSCSVHSYSVHINYH